MVIEKGVHADIDELAQLYDDLNDFLDSDINHPGWIKGVYPVRQIAEAGINEQHLHVVRLGQTRLRIVFQKVCIFLLFSCMQNYK